MMRKHSGEVNQSVFNELFEFTDARSNFNPIEPNAMISKAEIKRRIKYNNELVRDANSKFEIAQYMATLEHGIDDTVNDYIIASNSHDIFAGLSLGILPSTAKTGFDGIEIINNVIVEDEFKNSSLSIAGVWRGARNGLYIGLEDTPNRRVSVASKISGRFAHCSNETLESKNRQTYLTISDGLWSDIICAYRLSAEETRYWIQTKKLTSISTTGFDIKLSRFLNYGDRCATLSPSVPWTDYARLLQKFVDKFDDWNQHQGQAYNLNLFKDQYQELLDHQR